MHGQQTPLLAFCPSNKTWAGRGRSVRRVRPTPQHRETKQRKKNEKNNNNNNRKEKETDQITRRWLAGCWRWTHKSRQLTKREPCYSIAFSWWTADTDVTWRPFDLIFFPAERTRFSRKWPNFIPSVWLSGRQRSGVSSRRFMLLLVRFCCCWVLFFSAVAAFLNRRSFNFFFRSLVWFFCGAVPPIPLKPVCSRWWRRRRQWWAADLVPTPRERKENLGNPVSSHQGRGTSTGTAALGSHRCRWLHYAYFPG